MQKKPVFVDSLTAGCDWIFSIFERRMHLATPLGLGKPNQLLNLIYNHAKNDPAYSLTIETALSLAPPAVENDLAKRFFEPFALRQWGKDYPELLYARDALHGNLPENVQVSEFYFQAGAALHSTSLQRRYLSVNYTHVAQSILDKNVQIIVQLVSRRGDQYSLSCNPDVTLDIVRLFEKHHRPLIVVGVLHPDLPFLGGEAQVGADFFDLIVDAPHEVNHQLFALPRSPIDTTEQFIALHVSQLIPDGGTLQIGIGSLSDAVVHALIFRHQKNKLYRAVMSFIEKPHLLSKDENVFAEGLYGLSEMVMDGFMHLRRAGILKRLVKDEKTGRATFLHGSFFLGSKEFYEWLRTLSEVDFDGIRMTPVSKVNDLYDPQEVLLRRQRKHPRFLNTCMQVTLLGGAASETLEDGRVVSGVGGQYNFVAMAHELEDSHSVLMLRSTRQVKGRRSSNIVWSHGHLTIPRHLRDIVATEYGIADLRSKTDEEVIQALIQIADAEFQPGLRAIAIKHGKLSPTYQIPEYARKNTPQCLSEYRQMIIKKNPTRELFRAFPFGSDFTPEEERLALALSQGPPWITYFLHNPREWGIFASVLKEFFMNSKNDFRVELGRLNLYDVHSPRTWFQQRLVLLFLNRFSR